MNVQKSVYGPRLAVRGSVISSPLLSRFVTGVSPGLWDQYPLRPFRYQWKSEPGHTTNATRWPSAGHLLFAPGLSMSASATAAGLTAVHVSPVYIAPAALPGCAKVSDL